MTDDNGAYTPNIVIKVVDRLALPCEVVIVRGDAVAADPDWHPRGPRLDAMPDANQALAEHAAASGAGVILTGDGADELLAAPRYLTGPLWTASGGAAVRRYLRDAGGNGAVFELIGLLGNRLPRRHQFLLYWALNWPELSTAEAPAVLSGALQPLVRTWTAKWVRDVLQLHIRGHDSWAVADAWDSIFPLDAVVVEGPVPTQSPFLDQHFLATAQLTPLTKRFDPRLPTPYQRRKAQVVGLFSPEARGVLPRAKHTFAHEITRRYKALPRIAPTAANVGLIDSDALRLCENELIVAQVHAVERWLRGAVERGADVLSV